MHPFVIDEVSSPETSRVFLKYDHYRKCNLTLRIYSYLDAVSR